MNFSSRDFVDTVRNESDIYKLQGMLRSVESAVKLHVGTDPMDFYLRHVGGQEMRTVESLVMSRKLVLDKMFQATQREMEIFVKQNNRLLDLTNQMYHRTAQMYRMSLANMNMYLDGDDCDVEGKLVYSYNDCDSVLKYEEDRIYQSDFDYMIELVSLLMEKSRHRVAEIESAIVSYRPGCNPSMTDEELDCVNTLDDGETWAEGCRMRPELDSICICHAVHDICTHKDYSIPDLLRMDDFFVDVCITNSARNKTEYDGE